jgi:ribosomal protein S21
MNKYRDTRKPRGIVVEVKHDDFGKALRIWSKKVQDLGLLYTLKEKMFYEKPAVERQRMKKQARRRWERQVEDMITAGNWHKDKKY